MARAETLKPMDIMRSLMSWHVLFAVIAGCAFVFTIVKPEANLVESKIGPKKGKAALADSEEVIRQAQTMEPSILAAEGKFDQAMSKAHTLAKAKPYDVASMLCVGNVLFKVGDKEEGFRYMKRAVALAPRSRYVRLDLAHHLAEDKQYPAAELQYNLIIQAYPDWAKPRVELAGIYADTNRAPEAADQLKLALEAEPNNFEARRLRAICLAKSGQGKEGLAEYVLADSIEQQVNGLPKDIRQMKENWGTLDRAAFQLLRERQERPEDPAIRLQLARLHLYMGHLREAKQLLNEARKSAPTNWEIRRNMALLLQKMGDSNMALSEFNTSIKLEGQSLKSREIKAQ